MKLKLSNVKVKETRVCQRHLIAWWKAGLRQGALIIEVTERKLTLVSSQWLLSCKEKQRDLIPETPWAGLALLVSSIHTESHLNPPGKRATGSHRQVQFSGFYVAVVIHTLFHQSLETSAALQSHTDVWGLFREGNRVRAFLAKLLYTLCRRRLVTSGNRPAAPLEVCPSIYEIGASLLWVFGSTRETCVLLSTHLMTSWALQC